MIKSILLASACLSLLPPAAPAQELNAKLRSSQVQFRKVCVMPVTADWVKVTLKARQPLTQEADTWSVGMQSVISKALANVGAEEVPMVLGKAGPDKDESDRRSILRLQRKYDDMARLMHRHPGGIKSGRFSLGDEVALAPCAAQADAILFVRHTVRDTILPVADYPALYLSIVDPKSGEVLAHVQIETLGNGFRTEPEKLYMNMLLDKLRRMRVGAPVPKRK